MLFLLGFCVIVLAAFVIGLVIWLIALAFWAVIVITLVCAVAVGGYMLCDAYACVAWNWDMIVGVTFGAFFAYCIIASITMAAIRIYKWIHSS